MNVRASRPKRCSARFCCVTSFFMACVVLAVGARAGAALLIAALLCAGCAGSAVRGAAPPRPSMDLPSREHQRT